MARKLTGSHYRVSMKSLLSATLLCPVFAVGLFTGTAAPAERSAPPAPPALLSAQRPSAPQAAKSFAGMPQFGELVWQNPDGSPGARLCSAVAVDSAGGDLIATAAHCVGGVKMRIGGAMTVAYIPGAGGSAAPYGVWYPTRIIRAQQWMNGVRNPDFDLAFLTVSKPGEPLPLAAVTGSEHFGAVPADGALGVQIGYPDSGSQPVACRTPVRFQSPTQLRLSCAGFPSGTSGGPVLTHVDPVDGTGTLVGVLGGYQTGGTRPDVSYAAAFTPAIRQLYQQAAQY